MSTEQKFQKPLSLGFSLENGYFSEDGATGFNISTFAGRLTLSFWKKGEKSSESANPNDNKLTLNINQVMILNKVLAYIIQSRVTEFRSKGIEGYSNITNISFPIQGMISNQIITFGTIRFDTVEIEGIKRVKMSIIKDTYNVSIVFCDKYMKNIFQDMSKIKIDFDVLDASFLRFCTDINNYLNFSWTQGAFNKVFNVISGKSNSNGSYQNSSQKNTPRYSNTSSSSDSSDDLFNEDNAF